MRLQGKVYIVGIGPGSKELLTLKALKALQEAEVILGHKSYIDQIRDLLHGKEIIESSMGKETERVKKAIELAKNKVVALVSGGDPSIYGIYSLFYEYVSKNKIDVEYEVIPGVTAISACSPLLGCAVSGDHVVLSLSDRLTPWDEIEKKLRLSLEAGFVVAIYNPSSSKRRENFLKALKIMKEIRGDLKLGIVKNGWREGQEVMIKSVSELLDDPEIVDMHCIVFIPSKETIVDEKMLTPRGYSRKYEL